MGQAENELADPGMYWDDGLGDYFVVVGVGTDRIRYPSHSHRLVVLRKAWSGLLRQALPNYAGCSTRFASFPPATTAPMTLDVDAGATSPLWAAFIASTSVLGG